MEKINDKRGLAARGYIYYWEVWGATCPLNFGYIIFRIGLAVVIIGAGPTICNRDFGSMDLD